MSDIPSLYKRATQDKAHFDALWDIHNGKTFFTGPLYYNAHHQHGAPVFLAGIYGSFRLRMQGGDWVGCRTAVIPAGAVHELEIGGDPLTVLYIEPNVAGIRALTPLSRHTREVNGALVGSGGELAFMRALYEDRYNSEWSAEPLDDLLGFGKRRSGDAQTDPRIARAVEFLFEHGDDLSPVAVLAESVGLSASRFQHLFSEQIGVPFRRYRSWNRMRLAIREIIKGHNFTDAAHLAGFSDSAHFSHDYRKTFGAAPTISLKKLARLQPQES
ncbi:MAG: AraC family transcriptional regulator [Methylococcales bacterium]|nr:AraC family transcriptional regulator [Methylococcales bacterium]